MTSLRKALVAGTAAVALTFGGTSVASAADATNTTDTTATETTTDSGSAAEFFGSSEDGEDVSPKEIREWIDIFTSIIRAIDTAFGYSVKK